MVTVAGEHISDFDISSIEVNWTEALIDFIPDFVTYPAGIIKGPVMKQRDELVWEQAEQGLSVATVKPVIKKYYECVSPFNIYPAPSSIDIDDGYLIEKHTLTRADLVELKGVKGYDSDAIDRVLEEYGRGGLRKWLWLDELEKGPWPSFVTDLKRSGYA